ncbi:MAG TPA: ATP-binding cassette domain-containing protein [Thermoplasmata archaeon]|nr:ATP-binding cassette domain-containing protein [Thermoplasmata archaeon]
MGLEGTARGAIVAAEISKTYVGKVEAVKRVSFAVRPGEVYGFLGPNGAGKTTTVSMLSAGLSLTAGEATVDGLDVRREPATVKRRIGVVFQESTADGDLTGRENLELAAALYSVPRSEVRGRVDGLLERMQLADAADRLAKTYSGGMRRRLELAAGIVHAPGVLFLDEPTLGLDPQGRAGFWRYVLELRKEHGMTVFVTTHYLEEADGMCDRIAIIDHGTIVASGTPGELKDRLGGDIVTVRPSAPSPAVKAVLAAVPGVVSVGEQDGAFRLKCANGEALVPVVVAACVRAGVGLQGVSLKRPSLDEVFLEFTGREFREEEGPSATDRAVMLGRVRSQMGGRR